MKKIIAALCASLLLLSVASCGTSDKGTESESKTEHSTKPQYEESSTSGNESGSESATSETPTETDSAKETESEKTYTDADFKTVDETVYVTADSLGLRLKPQSDAKIDHSLKFQAKAKRVGYTDKWSILEVGGSKYYALSEYLTTTNFTGDDFTDIERTEMYVTESSVNVRKYPASGNFSTSLGLLSKDDKEANKVTCISTNGKWYRIEYKDGIGYVSASCLSKTDPTENPFDLSDFKFYDEPIYLYVVADSLNIRQYPSADNKISAIVDSLVKGTKLTCYGDNGTWVQVECNGAKCYANGKYLGKVEGGDPIFGTDTPDLSDFKFYAEPKTMYVTAATLYVRKFPSDDNKTSAIVETLVKDAKVTCYGDNGTWVQIEWNGYKYYVGMAYLSDTIGGSTGDKPDLRDFTIYETPITMYVTASTLYVRLAPDFNSATLKDVSLKKGDAVVCTGCNDKWYQILIDGKNYYVAKSSVEATKPETSSTAEN